MPSKKRNTFVPLIFDSSSHTSQQSATFVIPKKGSHAVRIKSAGSKPVGQKNSSTLAPVENDTVNTETVNISNANKYAPVVKVAEESSSHERLEPAEDTRSEIAKTVSNQQETVSPSSQVKDEAATTQADSTTKTTTTQNYLRVDNDSTNSLNTSNEFSAGSESGNSSQKKLSAITRSKLNIFARKHVPLWLRLVNESYAIEIHAPPLKRFDYNAYKASFAGTSTLILPPFIDPVKPEPCDISHEALDPAFYQSYWHQRLQNEFTAQEIQLDSYNLYNVDVWLEDAAHNMYRFKIPGLRENTPRIDLGDYILLRPLAPILPNSVAAEASWWDHSRDGIAPGFTGQQHNAIAWSIMRRDESVLIRLGSFLPKHAKCNIIVPLQKHKCAPMWRAVMITQDFLLSKQAWLNSMLFPKEKDGILQASLSKGSFSLDWFDTELNFEQKRAVQAVVDANYGPVPYLISGPPGTGKSKTIVEIALQLLHTNTIASPHLLICAPSDAAADTLLIRLSKSLTPKELFRLNNWTRLVSEVPGEVRPYCHVDSNTLHSLPDFEDLMSLKIVVTTCRDANMLSFAGLTNSALADMTARLLKLIAPGSSQPSSLIHWTALLLDEAAQATEPEVLIPLSVIVPSASQLDKGSTAMPQFVLAGDEHQLGPLLASKHLAQLNIPIKTAGLEISLFQRLFARDLYVSHPLSRANGAPPMTAAMLPIIRPPFTNLIRNYRSHPAILSTSSNLFYSDTLIPERPDISAAILSWPLWPSLKKGTVAWPILFRHNASPDSVESVIAGDGTGAGSLENHGEARIALDFVMSLLRHDNEYSAYFAGQKVSPLRQDDIVVMSPFNAQVRNLRIVFREASLYDVRIGPLEAFQGLESRVVVLCTTRTRLGKSPHPVSKFVMEDKARGLGVIDEPKRFNVALTRPKEALIVIGNAEALTCTLDRCWLSFLEFCERNALFSTDTPFGLRRVSARSGNRTGMGKLERALVYTAGLIERREEDESYDSDQVNGMKGIHGLGGKFRLQGQMHDLDEMMRTVNYQQFEEEEAPFDAEEDADDDKEEEEEEEA